MPANRSFIRSSRGRWVAAFIASALIAGCASPDAPELLSRAEAAIDEGRYRAALVDLRSVVASEPENAEARFQLAVVSLTLGDMATAEKELRRARERGYDEAATLEPMAEALIGLARAREALAELDNIEEPSAHAESLAGLAHEQLGQSDLALRAFNRALEIDPRNEDALLGKARELDATGDRQGAEALLDKARAEHADSMKVAVEYGRFLLVTQRPAEAEAVYQAAIDARTESDAPSTRWDLFLSLAESQLAQGKIDEAEQTVAALDEIEPDTVLAKYIQARIAFAREDIPTANELAARVVVEAPDFDPALLLQAKVFLANSSYTQARQVLARLVQRDPNNAEARRLLAAAEEGMAEQNDETRRAGRRMSQGDFLAMVGTAKAESGDIAGAVTFWEQSLKNDPGNQDVKLELISAYVRAGRMDDAAAMIEDTRWVGELARTRVTMVQILLTMEAGDLDKARGQAAAAAESFPREASIVTLQGLVEVKDNPTVAKDFFESALSLDPAASAAAINLASVSDRLGDSPNGVEVLRNFLRSNPEDAAVLEALGSKLLRAGDREQGIASLQAAREADPNAITPRLQLTQLLLEAGEAQAAELVAAEVVSLQPRLAAAHNALGVALLAQGKTAKATESLQQALRINPAAVDPLRNLLRAEVATASFAKAEQSADRLLKLVPGDAQALEVLARVSLARKELDLAEQRVSEYEAADPERSRLPALVMRGDIALARGDDAQALDYFERALGESPSPTLAERVFNTRRSLGRDDAYDVLTDWLQARPSDNGVRLLVAQAKQVDGDFDAAAAEYERILATSPRSLVALNNLALLYQLNEDERAVEIAKQAFDQAPNFPIIQDTYGWVLVTFGQVDNGVSLLRDAHEAAPDNGDIAYHLAAGLVRSGDAAQAKAMLEQALANIPQFESRDDAQALLNTL
ncbi:MAG: XrtA/PEP-CTERM system TPR-repeat protein PrsT [Pseudomonadota bacterium]